MNWINVKDQLPDDDTTVLTYDPHVSEPVFLGYYVSEEFAEGLDSGWTCVDGGTLNPTHWAELPEPPQD